MSSKYRRWSKEDDNFLRDNFHLYSNIYLGNILNRSPDKVTRRAIRLGLGKKPKVLLSEINSNNMKKYLSKNPNSRIGDKNPNYKGGHIDKDGYRIIKVNGIGRREHRVVMESVIGRKLLPSEAVHHINGDKLDNRPENLVVMSFSEHQKLHGQYNA